MQREQAVDLLRPARDLIEVAELALACPAAGAAGPGRGDDALEVDGCVRHRLLGRQVGGNKAHGKNRGPSQCDDANHEALLKWPTARGWGRPPTRVWESFSTDAR